MFRVLKLVSIVLLSCCAVQEDDDWTENINPVAMKVDAVAVIPKSIGYDILADGKAEAVFQQPLFFHVAGQVTRMSVPGSRVSSGDTLAVLDDTEVRLLLRQAAIRLEEASYAFESAMMSYRRASVVTDTVRKSVWHSSGLAMAEAVYAQRKQAWHRHFLLADRDGVVAGIEKKVGVHLAAAEHFGLLYDPAEIRVGAYVLELYKGRVTSGMHAILTDLSGQKIEGSVETVDFRVDGDGFFRVWIRPEKAAFWPGEHVSVTLRYQQHEGLAVPVQAVMERSERLMVYRVQNDTAQWQYIQGGMQTGEYLEVLDGLQPGDTIITNRLAELGHGMPVVPDLNETAGRSHLPAVLR